MSKANAIKAAAIVLILGTAIFLPFANASPAPWRLATVCRTSLFPLFLRARWI